jgi:uncharacterized membrane protein YfcA
MSTLDLIFSSPSQFLAACAILALAQAIYVLFGFGSGLIAVGTLALLMPEIQDVVVLLLLINLPSELYVVRASWRSIRWRRVLAISAGIALGIPLGSGLLKLAEPMIILDVLAVFLILTGLLFLILTRPLRIRWPPWVGPILGAISGVLGGLFGTGGPPLILYYQLTGAEKSVFRGNLMAIFLLTTLVRTPSYLAWGLITWPRLFSGLALLPAALLGAWIGARIHLELSESAFRKLVSLALILIGAVLLAR